MKQKKLSFHLETAFLMNEIRFISIQIKNQNHRPELIPWVPHHV